jgi:hypothetical protein
MGRKRKVHGYLYERESPRGKSVRMAITQANWARVVKHPAPRGKTGRPFVFASVLKEFSPFVYAFTVDQLRQPEKDRDPMIRPILAEYERASGSGHRRPQAKEFAAFIIERAMKGAWEVWKIQPPYTGGDVDNFLRRYVHGQPGALRDYRKILRSPQPWPPEHRGHWLKYFFGPAGQAAREFRFLKPKEVPITVIALVEEENPQRPT